MHALCPEVFEADAEGRCRHVQRRAYKELLAHDQPRLEQVLYRRLCSWLRGPVPPQATSVLRRGYKAAAAVLPEFALAAGIKTLCNAWPTQYRFQGVHAICPMGCSHPQGDDLRHILLCPVLCSALASQVHCNWPHWPLRPSLASALGIDPTMDRIHLAASVALLDVGMSAHRARRHGDTSPIEGLIAARVRMQCRHRSKTIALYKAMRDRG